MKRIIFQMVLILCLSANLFGQHIDLSTQIDIKSNGLTLEEILDELENRYQFQFSYSRDVIPVNQKMYVDIDSTDCKAALDKLFEQTQVVYGIIGNQMVLAIDFNKEPKNAEQGLFGFPNSEDQWASNGYQFTREVEVISILPIRKTQDPVSYFKREEQYQIQIEPGPTNQRITYKYFEKLEREMNAPQLHVSLIHPIGIQSNSNKEKATNLGLHMTWGHEKSLRGASFAAIGSTVADTMVGAQFSSVFNGSAEGIHGVQSAGVVNVALGESVGIQMAGVVNIAKDIDGGQLSGFINIAKNVKGFQLGIINIADSVSGPSIGLLSFVRKGYQSIGLSYEDAIDGNVTFRIGTYPFYNIFKFGMTKDQETWSLGYGIGTSLKMGKKHKLQFELISSHVNENKFWTTELNLLNQLNITANFKIGKHFSIALGPSFNVGVSQLYKVDTEVYGLELNQNILFERTSHGGLFQNATNVKGWIGFNAGIRFDSR